MGRRRVYADQGAAVLRGFEQGMRIASALKETSDQAGLEEAMNQATTEEQSTVSEVNAPDSANYTKDSETGNYAPSLAAVQSGVSETLNPIVEPQYETKTERVDKQFASPADKRMAMMQAGIDYWSKKGRPGKAFDLQEKVDQQQARAQQFSAAKRRQSDEDELRGALSDGRLSVRNALPTRNEAMRYSTGTGADITGASGSPEHQSIPAEGARQTQPQAKDTEQQYSVDSYLRRIAPQAVQTLLKQGRLSEAKQFTEFVESEQGKAYAGKWLEGVRKHAIGDSAGALESFEKMYNGQLYNDGHSVRMTPLEDGKQYRIDQINADGQVLGSKTGMTADLANQAAHALSPMSAVKFHAEQQAQREKEGALLDRQIQVKQLDAQRAEMAEDRRDERLATRLNADAARREATDGLTLTQRSHNTEIDAARESVAGMDPAEIRRKTAKQTDTGRENPDYDPTLAKAASLAGRRKIGTDDVFDRQAAGKKDAQPSQPRSRESIAKEFRSNRKLDNYTLGKELHTGTDDNGNPATGYPVIDKSGRIVGVFN